MDERTELISGRVAFFIMSAMQICLSGALGIRRYVLGQQGASYPEVYWILFLSILGYWGFRVYLSGVLTPLPLKKTILIYGVLEAFFITPTLWIHGLPTQKDWLAGVIPMLVAPAALLGIYNLVAGLGKKRLESQFLEKE